MLRKTISFLTLLLLVLPLCAQPRQSGEVRGGGVGVVMSGGGAKGLYHIGVLEALEQYGVPIDYVAGTSMGSIIAAMYAAGYSPSEMREIVYSGAVQEWVSGRIDPNKYMSYYRQAGRSPSFVSFGFDLKNRRHRFRAPKNLISSTQVDMALLQLFSPANVASGGDFNRLMIPFLCVASDMNRREPVVFRRGNLCEALRASMSIPLVFKPVKLDSMLLYDGGIYDNFPWKPMEEHFHPSFMVGSICTDGNTPPSEESNIMDQAFMLAMQITDYEIPEERGVTIAHAVDAGMLDFDRGEEIIDRGYNDAVKAMPKILARVPARMTAADYDLRRKMFRARCPELLFGDYRLDGLSDAQKEYIRNFVNVDHHSGRQRNLTYEKFRDNLYGVLADGDFVMDYPVARYDSLQGKYAFEARFSTTPNMKVTIGGNVSSTAFNQAYVGFNYRFIGRVAQQFGVDLYLGPLYTWGAVGGRTDFYMWKPLYIDYAYNFSVKNFRHGAFGNVTRIRNTADVKSSESFASLGLGVPFLRRSVFTLRGTGGHINYHYDADPPVSGSDHSRFSFFGVKAEVARNTLDKFLYPRLGSDLKFSVIYVSGSDKLKPYHSETFLSRRNREWVGARLKWDKYFGMGGCRWFSLGVNFDAVVTNHPEFQTQGATLMSLPSFDPVPHSQMIFMPDFKARRFVGAGVLPTFSFSPKAFVRTSFFAMMRERRAPWWVTQTSLKDDRWHYAAELSLVYHTPLGPVSLALTKYDLKSWKNMYLTFNFGCPLFAPKGTFY